MSPTLVTFIYLIQPGDTLTSIAATYGTTVTVLLDINPQITDPNVIIAGDELLVPVSQAVGGAPGGTVPNSAVNTHPYCGACGYRVAQFNVTDGFLCDSCGADLTAFGIAASTTGSPTTGWNGWAPQDIATAIAGATGDPATVWTTGQYIKTGEGDDIYWDGTTWQAGRAA